MASGGQGRGPCTRAFSGVLVGRVSACAQLRTFGIADSLMKSFGGRRMTYQDQKLRAILRLTLLTSAISTLLTIIIVYPERTDSVVRHIPLSRTGDNYIVLLGALITLVPICWGVVLGLIFTSPEQEVRFVRWTKRWRRSPIPFEEIEFDTRDPDYLKPAWRYFLDRSKR
jgi:hypothetical protein